MMLVNYYFFVVCVACSIAFFKNDMASSSANNRVSLLDYGAGNVRSLRNAIKKLGYEVDDIFTAEGISSAKVIIFPGVGSYGQAMKSIVDRGWRDALIEYVSAGRPFLGICLGMQCLFEGSDESADAGLGIIPGLVTRFDPEETASGSLPIPHIGWNGISPVGAEGAARPMLEHISSGDSVYFVHSFCVKATDANAHWALTTTDYGSQRFVSMVQNGNVVACQFHPEKSGSVGLQILDSFLSRAGKVAAPSSDTGAPNITVPVTVTRRPMSDITHASKTTLLKRAVACLDVRENDHGDLVVTKGDQYDVREGAEGQGCVRNLGKPVALCKRYYEEGADEIVFLNITSFRREVLDDQAMLAVLEAASEEVFVPLTVGGGIRGYTDDNGVEYSALNVAARYFRAGADKVSIGGDAVTAAESLRATGMPSGTSAIELISQHYGAQAVVVSIDPKRVYGVDNAALIAGGAPPGAFVAGPLEGRHVGPNGEQYCWWQCTIKGGREVRPIDAMEVALAAQRLGAGELMVNCIDMDGQKAGYDDYLLKGLRQNPALTIPIIASSGAGAASHLVDIFQLADVSAALAAGMFHRNDVSIAEVKAALKQGAVACRK